MRYQLDIWFFWCIIRYDSILTPADPPFDQVQHDYKVSDM